MASSHVIKVTMSGGKPTVDPDECRVLEGDDIRWTGPEKFQIAFEKDSPVGGKALDHATASSANQVRSGTRGRFYRYSVAPEGNPGRAVDPVIIVADPSKGSGGGA